MILVLAACSHPVGEGLFIDVGSEEDGPYDASRGFGWLGEAEVEPRPDWIMSVFPIATGRDADPGTDPDAYFVDVGPHLTTASGLDGYRVDVDDGTWTVTVHLLEPFYPDGGLRAFDLDIEGVLWPALDLGEAVGQDRVVALSATVQVVDGSVDVSMPGGVLSAIELVPGAVAAVAPTGLEARAGAGENLLRWDAADTPVSGWLVQRDGEVLGVALANSFVDRSGVVGETVSYRVTTLDAAGLPAGAVDSSAVATVSAESFGLPVVDLVVADSDLASLYADPSAELEVEVQATLDGVSSTGLIELRGQSTRWLPKRSYNLDLPDGKVKLLAETSDFSRMQQPLSYDLYAREGMMASQIRQVIVRLNGEILGVYDDIEAVGDDFLEDRGIGVDDRWRIRTADFSGDLSGFEKKENETDPSLELEALLQWLSDAPDDEVAATLGDWFDPDRLADYLAGQILVANPEIVDGGHYLVLDPVDASFLIVPWDLNNSTWTRPEEPMEAYTAYAGGWEYHHFTRTINDPDFRNLVADRVQAALDGGFAPDVQHAAIDAVAAHQQAALDVEPYLFERRFDDWQRAMLPGLHTYVDARIESLTRQIPAFRRLGEDGLVLMAVHGDGLIELESVGSATETDACTLSLGEQSVPVPEAAVAPGERVQVVLAPPIDGGRVTLSCGGEEGGEDEVDEGWAPAAAATSLVHVPPLAPGDAYVRDDMGWTVAP